MCVYRLDYGEGAYLSIFRRDCRAEPVLSEILRSLCFLRMTRSEGLAMTEGLKAPFFTLTFTPCSSEDYYTG